MEEKITYYVIPSVTIRKCPNLVNVFNGMRLIFCQLPSFVEDKIPVETKNKLFTVAFYDGNDSYFRDRFNSDRIYSRDMKNMFQNHLDNLKVQRWGDKRMTENVDYFIVEVPVRKYADDFFKSEENEEDYLIDRKCLLLSNSLFDKGDERIGTRLSSKTKTLHYFGKFLFEALVENKQNFVSNSYTGDIYRNNEDFKDAISRQSTNIDDYLEKVDTMNSGNMAFGGKYSEEGKIGIYWDFGNNFKVVQFIEDLDFLYYSIVRKYNKAGMDKYVLDKDTNDLSVMSQVNKKRPISGLDSYYSLYNIYGFGDKNPNGQKRGKKPEVDVDYALFNNVRELLSWVKEAGEDTYNSIQGKKLSNTELRSNYILAHRLTGNKLPSAEVEKRDNSLEYFRTMFAPIVNDIEQKGTTMNNVAESVVSHMKDIISAQASINPNFILPPSGKYYKIAFESMIEEFGIRNGANIIDFIAKQYCKKYHDYNFGGKGNNFKEIDQNVKPAFIKKVIASYVKQYYIYPTLGNLLKNEEGQTELNERYITYNDLKYMINEVCKRILTKK